MLWVRDEDHCLNPLYVLLRIMCDVAPYLGKQNMLPIYYLINPHGSPWGGTGAKGGSAHSTFSLQLPLSDGKVQKQFKN